MSIIGLGIDIVEVERIDRLLTKFGETFVRRITLPGEARIVAGSSAAPHVAGLFAAKEAVLKALGTGWAQGLGFQQIEISRTRAGQPQVRLHGAAADRSRELGAKEIHLSITHERAFAAAVAILEGPRG